MAILEKIGWSGLWLIMSIVGIAALLVGVLLWEEPKELPVYSLQNGGFEDGTAHWALRHGFKIDYNNFHSGKTSVRSDPTYYDANIDPTVGDARAAWISKSVEVKEGQRVFASAWIKTEASTCPYGLRIGLDFKATNHTPYIMDGEWAEWSSSPNVWRYRQINGFVPSGKGIVKVTLWLQGKPYDCNALGWFDDVVLEVYDVKEE